MEVGILLVAILYTAGVQEQIDFNLKISLLAEFEFGKCNNIFLQKSNQRDSFLSCFHKSSVFNVQMYQQNVFALILVIHGLISQHGIITIIMFHLHFHVLCSIFSTILQIMDFLQFDVTFFSWSCQHWSDMLCELYYTDFTSPWKHDNSKL